MYRQSEKNIKQQYLLHISPQYGELRRTTAEIGWPVWGISANFNGFRVLSLLLQRRRSPEANQTLHDVWPSHSMVHYYIHRVSKNVPPMTCYNFVTHEQILIFMAEMLPLK